MAERLTFERQVSELQTGQDKPVCRIDFYDQIDPHLRYLGRLIADAPRARWQIRLVDPGNLKKIFDANRLPVSATSSNYAISLPGRGLEDTLYPESVGLVFSQPRFDYVRIAQQVRGAGQSLLVQVTPYAQQKTAMDGLVRDATRANNEQGMYIVIEPKHAQGVAGLYFVRARPLASSSDEFTFSLGTQTVQSKKIIYVSPSDRRQVIGTVHTHYLKSTGLVNTTSTRQGTTITQGQRVQRIVHEVSALDVKSAKDNEFVVYAIEEKELHKATPAGKALNRLKPVFNLLVDALETFAGKRPPISGAY